MLEKIKNSKRGQYSEAFDKGFTMSLAQSDGKKMSILFPFTTCKDFLNDVIWSEKTGAEAHIYGFDWVKKGILNKSLYLVLKDGTKLTKVQAKNLEKNLKFFAKTFGQKQGRVGFYKNHIFTKVDKGWFKHPYLFAMYTLFMSSYDKNFETLEEYYEAMRGDKVRSYYFTNMGFDRVLTHIAEGKPFNFKTYSDCGHTSTIHNCSGLDDIREQNGL